MARMHSFQGGLVLGGPVSSFSCPSRGMFETRDHWFTASNEITAPALLLHLRLRSQQHRAATPTRNTNPLNSKRPTRNRLRSSPSLRCPLTSAKLIPTLRNPTIHRSFLLPTTRYLTTSAALSLSTFLSLPGLRRGCRYRPSPPPTQSIPAYDHIVISTNHTFLLPYGQQDEGYGAR
jgi:hypothetical protein